VLLSVGLCTPLKEEAMSHQTQAAELGAPLGFGDLAALPGNHIAHFYRTMDGWLDLLVSYHKAGLEAGDKCVYFMQPDRRDGWLNALAATGVDMHDAFASGQLVFIDDEDESSLEEWQQALGDALAEVGDKYRMLRSGADADWAETYWHCESHITPTDYPGAVFLCQYDISSLSGDVVLDAFRTHPVCIVGEAIVENPFYEEPEVFEERLTRSYRVDESVVDQRQP